MFSLNVTFINFLIITVNKEISLKRMKLCLYVLEEKKGKFSS